MSNHAPKVPVRFIKANDELLDNEVSKGYSEYDGVTDYRQEMDADIQISASGPQSSYRTPDDRINGNVMFRRYLNGKLDMDHACANVIDAINRYKEKDVPCYTQEYVALQVIFPTAGFDFEHMDPGMLSAVSAVNLKLLPQEVLLIRAKVTAHLAEVLNWNAGLGGGSVPGRSQTYTP